MDDRIGLKALFIKHYNEAEERYDVLAAVNKSRN